MITLHRIESKQVLEILGRCDSAETAEHIVTTLGGYSFKEPEWEIGSSSKEIRIKANLTNEKMTAVVNSFIDDLGEAPVKKDDDDSDNDGDNTQANNDGDNTTDKKDDNGSGILDKLPDNDKKPKKDDGADFNFE